MSNDPIPDRIDPVKIFNRLGQFDSDIAVSRLRRFSHYLSDAEATIKVKLRFSRDDFNRRVIAGVVNAAINITCQRCLEAAPLTVNSEFSFVVVASQDKANELEQNDKSCELLVVANDERIELISLIEDELILSLPIVAYHKDGQCDKEEYGATNSEQILGANSQVNPFSVLGQLKKSE